MYCSDESKIVCESHVSTESQYVVYDTLSDTSVRISWTRLGLVDPGLKKISKLLFFSQGEL